MPTLARRDQGSHAEAVGFVGDEPAFAMADGRVDLNGLRDVHEGGLLAAVLALDGSALVTGGEDGRVCAVAADGVREIASRSGKWIDVLAAGPAGSVGFASGRTAWLVDAKGAQSEFTCERAIEGLAFAPKGQRLLCARYGGVSLFFAGNPKGAELLWDGAHTGVTVSPDGKYVVTTMQEPALHGWRLGGKGDPHMRMTGYPSKVRSLAWSPGGRWLATSGASSAVCWPFAGKGPQGQAPKQLGDRADRLVVRVACHPKADVVAIGYDDGMIMLVRMEDAGEVLLKRPGEGDGPEISALSFDRAGDRLAFGTAGGEAGVISLA